jgi:hypothetical protein
MGRPLNKKYFANTNYQDFGTANVGGESIASVTAPAGTLADLVNGTYPIPAAQIGAPNVAGGAKPVLRVIVTGATAYTVEVVSAGSGYTSAPTITFNGSVAGGSGSATPVATLTSSGTARQNGLMCEAQIPGGSDNTAGDVIKQVGARRFKVQTADGTAILKLVATENLADGQMSIRATDSAGGTYFVTKISNRKCTLVPAANVWGGTSSAGAQFASGATAKWTFGSAVLNTTVTLDNQ